VNRTIFGAPQRKSSFLARIFVAMRFLKDWNRINQFFNTTSLPLPSSQAILRFYQQHYLAQEHTHTQKKEQEGD
jgi:hypothetical protein